MAVMPEMEIIPDLKPVCYSGAPWNYQNNMVRKLNMKSLPLYIIYRYTTQTFYNCFFVQRN